MIDAVAILVLPHAKQGERHLSPFRPRGSPAFSLLFTMGDYGGSSSLSSSATAELHLKMSKKIAQLTKVIFHLNTRNEDFQSEFAHLKQVHAIEQQQLTVDAAAKLKALSEQLQSHKDADARAARDKQQLLKDLATFQQLAATQQQNAQHEFQRRAQMLEEQVETSRRAFVERIQQLTQMAETQQRAQQSQTSATTTAIQAAHRKEMDELKQKHSEEVEQVVMSSNARFTQMLGEQLKLQDALRAELATHRTQWEQASTQQQRTQQMQWQQEREEAQRHFDEMKQQLVSKMEQLLADTETLRGRETRLRADKEDLLKTQGELQRQIKMLELQVSKAQHETQSVRKDSDVNTQKLAQTLATSQDKCGQLAEELETLKKTLVNRDAALQQVNKTRDALQLELLNGSASLSEKHAQYTQQLSERDLKLATLQADLAKQQQQTMANEALATKRLQALEARVAELTREKEELEKQIASAEMLRASVQTQTEKTQSELKARLQEAEKAAVSLRADHAKLMEELKRGHAQALEILMRSHTEATETLKRDAETRVRNVEAKLTQHSSASMEKALSDAKQEHTQAIAQLRAVADANEAKWTQQNAQRDAELQKLQAEVTLKAKETVGTQAKLTELTAKLLKCEEQLKQAMHEEESRRKASQKSQKDRDDAFQKQLQALIAQHESVVKRLVSEKDRLTADHTKTLEQLSRDHADKLLAMQSAWEKDRASLLASQKEELIASYEQQLSDLGAELTSERERAEEAGRAAHDRLQQLHESRSSDMEAYGAEIRWLQEEAARRAVELNQSHAAAMEMLSSSHAQERDRLVATHKSEMDEWLRVSRAQADGEQALLLKQHAEAIATLNEAHATALQSLQEAEQAQRHSETLAGRAEMARQLKELRSQKDAEHARLTGEADKLHSAQLAELTRAADSLSASLSDRTSQLDASNRECASLRLSLDAKTRELHELERLNREELATMRRAAERESARVLKAHAGEIQQLSQEFEEARRLMGDSVAALKRTAAEWEAQYLRRESRAEDVARIALLEQAGRDKDALVKQTLDEMAYFKRELLNREEMYNKTFARAPNVGVLQVLKPHVLLQAQVQNQMNQMSSSIGAVPMPPMSQQSARRSKALQKPEELRRRSSERGTPGVGVGAKKALPPLGSNNNQAVGL
jgi:hypothetical protein